MSPSPADLAFVRFQATGRPDALAEVFDLTAADLLRVAAHLAADAHAAEDLVQETFLAAIESRATFTAGGDVAAWLTGILRNRARRGWRAQAQSVAGAAEATVVGPRAADPAAEVQAMELTAEVDAAVQQLPETYRPVLRLHLRHALNSAEIALALDRPAGSVRTQLGRGLALLRARLPRGLAIGAVVIACAPRGLAALRESVVEAAARIAAPAATPVAIATLALTLTMKKILLSVAAAAIVILAGAWQLGAFASPTALHTATPTADLRSDRPPVPAATVSPTSAPTVDAPTREELIAPARTGRQYGSVLVRVFWKDDGTPAPEVTVVLYDWSKPNPFLTTRSGVTGTDGTVRIERVLTGTFSVVTDDDKWASVVVTADTEATVDVFEPRWARVQGIVLDAAGAPVAGATVIRSETMNHTKTHALATTGADGRFAFALGRSQHVGARKDGHLDSYLTPLYFEKGESVDVTLRLRERAGAIAGTVRDTRGAPVHGALVTAGAGGSSRVLPDGRQVTTTPAPTVMTRADGTFRIEGLAAGPTTLVARALDCGIARHNVTVTIDETLEVPVTLEDGAVVEGRVVDERGRAVADATVATGRYGDFDSVQGTTAADGTFRLDSLPAGSATFAATKEKVGRASTTLELSAGLTATWEATLTARPVLHGRVVDEAGLPVAPAWVALTGQDRFQRSIGYATTTDGTFAIEVAADEPMRLSAGVRDGTFASVEIEDVTLDDGPLTVTLPTTSRPTAHVRGFLVAQGATDLRGANVFVQGGRRGLHPGFELDAATGAFSLGPFPPGEYRVHVAVREQPIMHLGTIRLEVGATYDLGRIRVGEAGSLRARVLGDDGKVLAAGSLSVLLRDGLSVCRGDIADGEAFLAQLAPGDYLVHAHGYDADARGAGIKHVTVRADQETAVELRPRADPLRSVTVREEPRPQHEPTVWVQVDVFDAAGVLVDRAGLGLNGADAWRLRVTTPPDGGGTLVVTGDSRERIRLPLPAEGPIEVTLR